VLLVQGVSMLIKQIAVLKEGREAESP